MLNKNHIKNNILSLKIPYKLIYWKDDGWYVGQLKEKPSVCSQGKTLKELKENIIDAYQLISEVENEKLAAV